MKNGEDYYFGIAIDEEMSEEFNETMYYVGITRKDTWDREGCYDMTFELSWKALRKIGLTELKENFFEFMIDSGLTPEIAKQKLIEAGLTENQAIVEGDFALGAM